MPKLVEPDVLPLPTLFADLRKEWLSAARGRSSNQLAEQFDVSPQRLSQWATGTDGRRPPWSAILSLCDELGYVVLIASFNVRLVTHAEARTLGFTEEPVQDPKGLPKLVELDALPLPTLFADLRREWLSAARGRSSNQLAEQFDVAPQRLSQWATGTDGRRPPWSVILSLCDELGHVVLVSSSNVRLVTNAEVRTLGFTEEPVQDLEGMPERKGQPYKDGELEVILSLAPTAQNIQHLASVLDRSPEAIEIVYRIAYDSGPFGHASLAQRRKVHAAKQRLGISIGPTDTSAKQRPTT